jgi:O-antigen/teichoic acid export membrane protein
MISDDVSRESAAKPADESVAASSGFLLAARFATSAGYFVAVVVIAHALLPAARGGVAFVTVTALLVAAASVIGLDNATMVYAARDESLRPRLLANLVSVTALMPLLVGGAVCLTLLALPEIRPGNVLPRDLGVLLAGSVAASIAECGAAYLVGCRRLRVKALADLAMPWSYATFLLLIYLLGHMTVTRAAAAWTCAWLLQAAVYFRAALSIAGIGRPSLPLLRTSVAFGVRSWAGSLGSLLNARADQTIMGLIATEQSLGIYAVAVNAGEVVLYLPSVVGIALLPFIAASLPAERLTQTLRIARVLLELTFSSLVVAAFAGWFLIPLIFGHAYQGSVAPFLWLLPGALGYAALRVFNTALLASDSPTRASIGPTVALVTGVALDFVLIPFYGAVGAAIAASLAFFAGGMTAVVVSRQKMQYGWSELIPRRDDARLIRGLARRAALSSRLVKARGEETRGRVSTDAGS